MQAVLRLTWGGLAKGNQSCNKPKQVSWGRGLQALGARALRGLGPTAKANHAESFVVLKKSPGGGLEGSAHGIPP